MSEPRRASGPDRRIPARGRPLPGHRHVHAHERRVHRSGATGGGQPAARAAPPWVLPARAGGRGAGGGGCHAGRRRDPGRGHGSRFLHRPPRRPGDRQDAGLRRPTAPCRHPLVRCPPAGRPGGRSPCRRRDRAAGGRPRPVPGTGRRGARARATGRPGAGARRRDPGLGGPRGHPAGRGSGRARRRCRPGAAGGPALARRRAPRERASSTGAPVSRSARSRWPATPSTVGGLERTMPRSSCPSTWPCPAVPRGPPRSWRGRPTSGEALGGAHAARGHPGRARHRVGILPDALAALCLPRRARIEPHGPLPRRARRSAGGGLRRALAHGRRGPRHDLRGAAGLPAAGHRWSPALGPRGAGRGPRGHGRDARGAPQQRGRTAALPALRVPAGGCPPALLLGQRRGCAHHDDRGPGLAGHDDAPPPPRRAVRPGHARGRPWLAAGPRGRAQGRPRGCDPRRPGAPRSPRRGSDRREEHQDSEEAHP